MQAIRRCISIGKSGFNYKQFEDMHRNLQQVHSQIDDVMFEGVGVLSRDFIKNVRKNSPVDFGLLESSWGYEIRIVGDFYIITIYNLALSENGEFYMEFVNDGHRIVQNGQTIGYVDGQFFLEGTEHYMETERTPKWKKNLENKIARLILNALS